MPIDFNDNLQIRAPKPIDDRYGPWETIEEGLINVPYPYRHIKLTLNIAGVEYWFKDGLEDVDLIVKQYGSVDGSKWEQSTMLAATTLHPRWGDSEDATIYGTDRFGFGALPTGVRASGGEYMGAGEYVVYYSSDNSGFNIEFDARDTYSGYTNFIVGYSVRAVRAAVAEEQLLPDGLVSATYTDYDGNVYQCTKIGSQVWTTSNLKVTHYADGTIIPTNLSDTAWVADTDGACAVYGKNDGTFIPTDELTTEALMVAAYGRLYNWYAVDNAHGLIDSTDGWHVPTDVEFTQLSDYLIATYPEITSDNVADVLKSVRQVNSLHTLIDSIHIKPKDNKRINADIIDNLPDPKLTLSLFKQGANGVVFPQIFKWDKDLTISDVLLMSNCASISIKIAGVTYTSNFIGLIILANTELEIININIQAGHDNANAIIIF